MSNPTPEAKPELDLVYLDVETTGLGPLAQPFEIAWSTPTRRRSLFLKHTLLHAEPMALKVNRYWERSIPRQTFATEEELDLLRRDLAGVCIVAANPRFDARFIEQICGYEPQHHRMMDIETFAVPVLGLKTPPGMESLARMLQERGFNIPAPDHTALGDIRALQACHEALMEIGSHQRAAYDEVNR